MGAKSHFLHPFYKRSELFIDVLRAAKPRIQTQIGRLNLTDYTRIFLEKKPYVYKNVVIVIFIDHTYKCR